MGIAVFPTPAAATKTVKGQAFTSNGNWTAPTGVNYVTVYALGGGGASLGMASTFGTAGNYNGSNAGGDSTFGTNLVIARGGMSAVNTNNGRTSTDGLQTGTDAPANSGQAGRSNPADSGDALSSRGNDLSAKNGTQITATVAVTPGTSYSVAVGAGGNIGTFNSANGYRLMGPGAGGSGFVSLTWEE